MSDGARNQRQLAFRAARQFRKRVEADAFDDSVLQQLDHPELATELSFASKDV